jgi:enterochelin esterase family protein
MRNNFVQTVVISVALLSILNACSPPPSTAINWNKQALDSESKKTDKKTDEIEQEEPVVEPVVEPVDEPIVEPVVDTPETPKPGQQMPPVVVTPPVVKPVEPPPKVISSDGDQRFNDNWKTVEKYDDSRNPKLVNFTMYAKDSKYFPKGNGRAPNELQNDSRKVTVFIPPNIDKSKEYPFMIAMDGDYWSGTLLKFVDKLVAEKKIPTMIFIIVENGGGDSIGKQRGLEYDVVAPTNASFLSEEVLPLVEKNYGIKLTKNGEGGGLFGGSSSGAAAFTAAWFLPSRFTKVLGYSSTFTKQGPSPDNPDGAEIYYRKLIAQTPVKPIRVSLQVAANDNKHFGDTTQGNILTYEALKAKGYHVRLHVSPNAVHTDGRVMKESMGDNLVWLWRDYPR